MNVDTNSLAFAQDFFTQIVCFSLPITIVFGFANMLVGMFLQSVFGGRLRIGGRR